MDLSREWVIGMFDDNTLDRIFPPDRTDRFFDALYGDAATGAYDIALRFDTLDTSRKILRFRFELTKRPGKCLRCSLTYGLPRVFPRHPVIDLQRVVKQIEELLSGNAQCLEWKLGKTVTISDDLHILPLEIRYS